MWCHCVTARLTAAHTPDHRTAFKCEAEITTWWILCERKWNVSGVHECTWCKIMMKTCLDSVSVSFQKENKPKTQYCKSSFRRYWRQVFGWSCVLFSAFNDTVTQTSSCSLSCWPRFILKYHHHTLPAGATCGVPTSCCSVAEVTWEVEAAVGIWTEIWVDRRHTESAALRSVVWTRGTAFHTPHTETQVSVRTFSKYNVCRRTLKGCLTRTLRMWTPVPSVLLFSMTAGISSMFSMFHSLTVPSCRDRTASALVLQDFSHLSVIVTVWHRLQNMKKTLPDVTFTSWIL